MFQDEVNKRGYEGFGSGEMGGRRGEVEHSRCWLMAVDGQRNPSTCRHKGEEQFVNSVMDQLCYIVGD